MKLTYETQPHGTRLSFAGLSTPLALGVCAWRQRSMGLPVSGVGTGIDVSTTENCTHVSEVEHRHT